MKKLLAFVIALTILVSIGTAVFAYPMPQDIGSYTNYSFNIGGSVIFPTERHMQFVATYGIHNNESMASGYFTTKIYAVTPSLVSATESKSIYSGQRIALTYFTNYSGHYEYGYRLSMTNQAYYGNSATGTWAPNDNVQ